MLGQRILPATMIIICTAIPNNYERVLHRLYFCGYVGGAHIDSYVCVPKCCRNATDGVADMQTNVCATREKLCIKVTNFRGI